MSASADPPGSDASFGFAAPPFNAEAALRQLQRDLRGLKLTEAQGAFQLRGKRVAELRLTDGALQARMARQLALTPSFESSTLNNTTDQRRWLDELKKRLARWDQED